MKQTLPTLAVTATLIFAGSAAHADFSANISGGVFRDTDGELMTSGIVLLLADLERDGFGNEGGSIADDTFTPDTDDDILAVLEIGENFGIGSTVSSFETVDAPEGTPLGLAWFNTVPDDVANGPGGGVDNGFYLLQVAAPPAGQTINIIATTDEVFSGTVPGEDLTATATTVPEPASIALLGLGGLLIARRRR